MSVTPPTPRAESVRCAVCHRANLTGGIRCAYRGAHFPSLDFDLTAPLVPAAPDTPAPSSPKKGLLAGGVGLAGTFSLLALKLKTGIVLFNAGKILTTLGSMALFIVAYARIFG